VGLSASDHLKTDRMKVIIDAHEFPTEIGLRILKAKYGRCIFRNIADIWESIPDLTFASIVTGLRDVDRRRIAFRHLGLQRMIEEVKPKLVSRQTLSKTTCWVEPDGSMTRHAYEDAYELYRVDFRERIHEIKPSTPESWWIRNMPDAYFVKCWDTSTQKEYVIWVDIRSVYLTNLPQGKRTNLSRISQPRLEKEVTPVQAIAWTIRTNIEPDGIEAIVRQGDCVLLRTKAGAKRIESPRHLTEAEYRSLMTDES
jgi:hypothetical protein